MYYNNGFLVNTSNCCYERVARVPGVEVGTIAGYIFDLDFVRWERQKVERTRTVI
jgi:hypothetical protein